MQDELLTARKYFYEFFSLAFTFMDEKQFDTFIAQAKALSEFALEDRLVQDLKIITSYDFKKFLKEQNAVFFDFSYVNIPLSASFYDEGRDDGKKRLQTCEILRKSPYRKDEKSTQSEDEFSFLFALMPYLIAYDENLAKELFEKILNSVLDEFINKLKIHKNSHFFIHFGNIMELFFEFERSILNLEKPQKISSKSIADLALERLPYQSKLPTQFSKIHINELRQL